MAAVLYGLYLFMQALGMNFCLSKNQTWSCRESLNSIAFVYGKNNLARMAEKNTIALILSEKNKLSVRTKNPSPSPEYQIDRAL